MLKTGIISQARMTSTRLPGKVMLLADGSTVLQHHVRRLQWSNIPVYVATTRNPSDDCIAERAALLSVPFHRGDEHNVLERFYECADKFGLEVIVRVTSDCPLVDGHIIAEAIERYYALDDKNVYYSNALNRRFPRGLDFEIFSFELLKDAYLNASIDSDKEHVTPYINQNRSGRVLLHHHLPNEDHSDLRWTLDTEDDWKLIKSLFEDYHVADLRYAQILQIVKQNPDLRTINNHIKQKEIKL